MSEASSLHRRLVVEVSWGPHLPEGMKKTVVAPGQKLRVGRGARADLSVPADDQLMAAHFELEWDGSRCVLRDLGSARGTVVDGSHVGEAPVTISHGSWIRAGQTQFVVWREGLVTVGAKADDEDDSDDEDDAIAARELARVERENARAYRARMAARLIELSRRERLHAVLDAARDERILPLLRTSPDDHRSLYDGAQGEGLADVAPYLVRFEPGSALLARIVEEGWGARWGIFLVSNRPFKDVRRHLRRFLMVEDDETGDTLYFRFYDPDILRTFLPTCSPRQAEEFWGDVEAFLFEDEDEGLSRIDRAAAVGDAAEAVEPVEEAGGAAC